MGIFSGSKFQDSDIYRPGAFNPGMFEISKEMVQKLRPESVGVRILLNNSQADSWKGMGVILNDGDINPSVVVSTAPLLVACYVSDFDAVVLQCYPDALAAAKGWNVGTRLINTCFFNGNGYWNKKNKDIDPGPNCDTKFKAVCPIIADLYTANTERLERKKREIPEELWVHTERLGRQYMANHPGMARNGLTTGYKDAVEISSIKFSDKIVID